MRSQKTSESLVQAFDHASTWVLSYFLKNPIKFIALGLICAGFAGALSGLINVYLGDVAGMASFSLLITPITAYILLSIWGVFRALSGNISIDTDFEPEEVTQ